MMIRKPRQKLILTNQSCSWMMIRDSGWLGGFAPPLSNKISLNAFWKFLHFQKRWLNLPLIRVERDLVPSVKSCPQTWVPTEALRYSSFTTVPPSYHLVNINKIPSSFIQSLSQDFLSHVPICWFQDWSQVPKGPQCGYDKAGRHHQAPLHASLRSIYTSTQLLLWP